MPREAANQILGGGHRRTSRIISKMVHTSMHWIYVTICIFKKSPLPNPWISVLPQEKKRPGFPSIEEHLEETRRSIPLWLQTGFRHSEKYERKEYCQSPEIAVKKNREEEKAISLIDVTNPNSQWQLPTGAIVPYKKKYWSQLSSLPS